MTSIRDLNSKIKPNWCPGCGNYGLFEALKRAIIKLKLPKEKVLVTYGIGCHGHMVNFLKTNGFQGLHGRPLPLAIGAKLANPSLICFASSGDGDAYSEGLNHLIGAARANQDVTLLVHNNWFFSLTTGQTSPTTPKNEKTKSTPQGAVEQPLNPLKVALASGATFVSQGFAGEVEHLTELIAKAATHKGFALVDVLQPCAVFGRHYSYSWFRERVYKVKNQGKDIKKAFAFVQESQEKGKFPLGIFYQVKKPTFSQSIGFTKPLVSYKLKKQKIKSLLKKI